MWNSGLDSAIEKGHLVGRVGRGQVRIKYLGQSIVLYISVNFLVLIIKP